MTFYTTHRPDPWTSYVEAFDETVQNLTACRTVDPVALAGHLQQAALRLYKFGQLGTQPAKPGIEAKARQVHGHATTDDAVLALTAFLQSGLDRGLAANSIAAFSEQVAARLQGEWH